MPENDTSAGDVRLTWWSASGLQEREVPYESIQSVGLNPTSGSKNPFEVQIENEAFTQYCRSIEWPENRCLRTDTDRPGGGT
jgi:hypothetical protein